MRPGWGTRDEEVTSSSCHGARVNATHAVFGISLRFRPFAVGIEGPSRWHRDRGWNGNSAGGAGRAQRRAGTRMPRLT
ncbi:hypothetical protein ACFSEO_12160 [Agromyces cerinus subsp. nitratus]|uniref:hypothetical protein n=1 Tax=Agromyces cerinus TaxID=33878 RepID=UPI00363D8034